MATVTIQKRKRKNRNSYLVAFKEPATGKKKHYNTYMRQREAQQAANDLRALLDSGRLPKKKIALNPLKFGKVADSLKEEWHKKLVKGELKPKTCEDYYIWLNVLNRVFGERLLCQIPREEIETYINTLAQKYTNVTANRYLFILKQVFCHGLILHAVVKNPAAEIKALSEKEHQRNEFLLPHKLNTLIEATQKIRAKFYLPAAICLGAEHGAPSRKSFPCVGVTSTSNMQTQGLSAYSELRIAKKGLSSLCLEPKKHCCHGKITLSGREERRG